MEIKQAQADVRRVYRGGALGPLVSAVVWGIASAVFQWASPVAAMAVLFFGGMLIFPLASLGLKLAGGQASLPKGHPSIGLAMQSAFTVPIGLLLALALGSVDARLFFPAAAIIVGGHYLTFISLYGMKEYAVLAALLVVLGVVGLFVVPETGGYVGWASAAVFLIATPLLLRAGRRSA